MFKNRNREYALMIENFVHQRGDNGAKLLSVIKSYIGHFSSSSHFFSKEDQEDTLQEIAITLLNSHKKIHSNYYGWLFRVSHNKCIDKINSNKRKNGLISTKSFNEMTEVGQPAMNIALLKDSDTDIIDCFDHVFSLIIEKSGNPQDKDIYLKHIQGLSNLEIANLEGRTQSAIAKRLSILKRKVKKLILELC